MPEGFFILSKENLQLAIDEVTAIAKSYDRFARIHSETNLVTIQTKTNYEKIANRATFVKVAGQVVKKMSAFFLDNGHLAITSNAKSFACRIINLSSHKVDNTRIENAMGNLISRFSNASVSLEKPEILIYLICTNRQSFFGFSKKPHVRKIKKVSSHPHELDNKLTRVMINLAGLKDGDTVCDPFCGTGTTLLEAQSMGMNSVGIDFDLKFCKMSQDNLLANDFESSIINADYKYLKEIESSFEGVVTDIPYGKNSKVKDNPEKIICDLMKVIPRRKKFAIMCKKGLEEKIDEEVNRRYDIYRHKSLTRTILVR